jgi:beta-lactam-binding protein with PASTA domain
MSDWNVPAETQFPSRFLTLGKALLLIAILVTVGMLSAIVGVRLAVRGDEVQVPALSGKTVEEAKKELSQSDLSLEVSGERYDSLPAGKVVSQLPPAGVKTKQKRPVQVIVSLGSRRNPVPNLEGASVRSAKLMLTQAGYEMGSVSAVGLPDVDREQIEEQYPTPQSTEIVNTKIDVLLSRPESPRWIMPDLLGQNVAVAMAFLEKHGLTVRPPVYRAYQNADRGAVVRQYPEPGYMVRAGDPISLEVAR